MLLTPIYFHTTIAIWFPLSRHTHLSTHLYVVLQGVLLPPDLVHLPVEFVPGRGVGLALLVQRTDLSIKLALFLLKEDVAGGLEENLNLYNKARI